MIHSHRLVLLYIVIVATLLLFSQTTEAGIDVQTPVLTLANGGVSKDGHLKLQWKTGDEVEVQQAANENFESSKTIYRGRDRAIFISGLENGTYYYRIRAAEGAWSEPISVKVKHHSLELAFILFSTGALVFALTVFIVVKGALNASVD